MMEQLTDLPEGVDGLKATGTVEQQDYVDVVRPLFEKAQAEGRRVRLLYHMGPEFEGFSAGAALEDAKVGWKYMRLFERCAVVSDKKWILTATRLVGGMLPCPVKTYELEQMADAVAWLAEPVSGALRHLLLPERGVLLLEPTGPLAAEDFQAVAATVDPWIEQHGKLHGVVIHAESFPGWENIGSLFKHLQFVKDHHRQVERVALVLDGKLAELASMLANHFVAAEVRQFEGGKLEEALDWAEGEKAGLGKRTVRDLMETEVHTVGPQTSLTELDREFVQHRVGGFPVVEDGALVGVVSRADVLRQLCVEQSLAENVSDYQRAFTQYQLDPSVTLAQIGEQVGRRVEKLHVRDVMSREVMTIEPDLSVREAAIRLLDNHLHRMPVVEEGKLIGIFSSTDLLRHVATA